MEKIYALSYELKKAIDNDERVILLERLENEMNNSEEVMKLAYVKDMKADNYENALRFFKEDSDEVKLARQELYLAKKALDEHPLVKAYLKAYSEVRDLYFEVNQRLFSILDEEICEH